jgi:hypothetical protein
MVMAVSLLKWNLSTFSKWMQDTGEVHDRIFVPLRSVIFLWDVKKKIQTFV